MTAASKEGRHEEIDSAIKEWRQGDCVVGEHWFAYRFATSAPLTDESVQVAAENAELVEVDVRGLAVLTQTCDIVRSCRERPFIEVAPLVEVEASDLEMIESGRRPQYGFVPSLREQGLVADLDRVMTVEKAVVASWDRTPGCLTDDHTRMFAKSLSRKRARFAFPDEFTDLARDLVERLKGKHKKQSDEGEALRALREIRVRAAPSWSEDRVELTFWFIRNDDDQEPENGDWSRLCEAWLALVPVRGRFQVVQGMVTTLDDLTARDYVESDPLDLDHLSGVEG